MKFDTLKRISSIETTPVNKVDVDVGSNVDNLSGKAYGFLKKSQISKMLEKYDKIFILPKTNFAFTSKLLTKLLLNLFELYIICF